MSEGKPSIRSSLLAWVILAVVALAICLVLVFGEREAAYTPHAAVGKRITRLQLQPLTDEAQQLSLGDLKGKVALINFWGTWCGPCIAEFPQLEKLRKKFRDRPDFLFISVSCGPSVAAEEPDQLRSDTEEFLRRFGSDVPVYIDPKGFTRAELSKVAGFNGYPTTVILDGDGVIRGIWDGYQPGDERHMERVLRELLDHKEV